MVARAGSYYREAFKGDRGVTQGNPLSPTIFNVVVDAVVRHWIEGLVAETAEKGETGREGRHQSAVFYAENRMVVSSDPAWLQGAFSALVAIFDRVGLRTNVNKTVSMACHPCWAGAGNWNAAGYSRRLTGVGKTFTERQRESGVWGVWDGNRGWIHVKSHDDSTWEGRNTAAPLGPPDEWGAQVV